MRITEIKIIQISKERLLEMFGVIGEITSVELNDFNGVVDIRVETSLKGDINE